jgi:hypothetical protein
MTQVFGVQFGNAILQNASHGVERTEDQDSISGSCRSNGVIEGFLLGRMGTGLWRPFGYSIAPKTLSTGQPNWPWGSGKSVKYHGSTKGNIL